VDGVPPDAEHTAIGWEVYPQGLTEMLARLHRDYRPIELLVTENGAAYDDKPGPDREVDDYEPQRRTVKASGRRYGEIVRAATR
jgi:beta-glucosidase